MDLDTNKNKASVRIPENKTGEKWLIFVFLCQKNIHLTTNFFPIRFANLGNSTEEMD